ncbi:FG-GAP repeat protein [Nannocystis pusilla]|uniref:FG-GAP repeat protein n=1 Tax=Nannocystis pusilla TaxID=889268 RepID=UPI003DA51492
MSIYLRLSLFSACIAGCLPHGVAQGGAAETDSDADTSDGESTGAPAEDDAASSSGAALEPVMTTTDSTDAEELPEAPVLSLGFAAIKQFEFTWSPSAGARHYQLIEQEGEAGEVVLADELLGTSLSLAMPLHLQAGASYVVRACNRVGCSDSEAVRVTSAMVAAVGYLKASDPDKNDYFGASVALSADGETLVVGAPLESSCASAVNGDASDNGCTEAGAAYVFVRAGQTWTQQAYLKPFNPDLQDQFGGMVAISGDGEVVAIGAWDEDSGAFGIDGDAGDESAPTSGAVYVFARSGSGWSQQAYLKPSNTKPDAWFGASLALSTDGDVLAVGAPGESSSGTGVDAFQTDSEAPASGAVYVFARGEDGWSQREFVKASNAEAEDGFGASVALAGDGRTLVVGAPGEDSGVAGEDDSPHDNAAPWSGAAYVFTADDGDWSQRAYLKAWNANVGDFFGGVVSISRDGQTIAVSADREGSAASGIDGDETDNSVPDAGAVYLFARAGGSWVREAYVKAPDTEPDRFGTSMALSADGSTLAVGAPSEDGTDVGVGGDPTNNSRKDSGAVFVYRRTPGSWQLQSYVKSPNSDENDRFGVALALSGDGTTLAVGASNEASLATGVGGDQSNNSGLRTGAVYLY